MLETRLLYCQQNKLNGQKTSLGELPGYLLSVVMIRDIVIVVGYLMISFFTGERVPVRPSYLGKLSTVMQLGCVIGVLARAGLPQEKMFRWTGSAASKKAES